MKYGDSLTSEARQEGTVPVYGSNGCVGFHNVANTNAPCIVIGRKGSFGKIRYSDTPVFAIDTTFFIDDASSFIDIRWLYFLLLWLSLDEVTKDSAVPGLDREDAYQRLAPLPPISEQAAIARYLDHVSERVDRYVGAKERLIALLKERRQAIIDRVVTRGLDPNAPMKPTGIAWMPEVPAHWEMRRLGQMGRLSKGNGGNKEDETSVGVPCVRYGDLYTTHSYFVERTRSFVSEETSKNYTPIIFGDVLFATSGETIDDIGKSAVNLMKVSACCGGDVILFRPEDNVVARYMGYALDCRSSAAQKATMGRGITVMHIYAGQLKRLLVLLPPISEQAAIVEYLDQVTAAIDAAIGRARRQIDLVREYRERLIDDVVTGKLDVREAHVAETGAGRGRRSLTETSADSDAPST